MEESLFEKQKERIVDHKKEFIKEAKQERINNWRHRTEKKRLQELKQRRKIPGDFLEITIEQCKNEVPFLNSQDPEQKLKAITTFRKILSIPNGISDNIQEVINLGVVPDIIQLMCSDVEDVAFEAIWSITNITSGTSEHTKYLIQLGVTEVLLHILLSNKMKLKEHAIWAIGNIAADSPEFRDLLIDHDVILQIVNNFHLPQIKLSFIRNASWALFNICRLKPYPPLDTLEPIFPCWQKVIHIDDEVTLIDICWSISYLSDAYHSENSFISFFDSISKRLVHLLERNEQIQIPILRIFGNIASGSDIHTDRIIDKNILKFLFLSLHSNSANIKKESCWTISNITAGNSYQIDCVMNAQIIARLIQIIPNAEFDVKKEATWALCNVAIGGNDKQRVQLVENKFLDVVVDLLKIQDTSLLNVLLESLLKILKMNTEYSKNLEENGTPDILASYQHHQNQEIATKISTLLDTYFEEEKEDN